MSISYSTAFYYKYAKGMKELTEPFLDKKNIDKIENYFNEDPHSLLMKHVSFLKTSPFEDLNLLKMEPSTDRERNYGAVSPKAELYLFGKNPIITKKVLEEVNRTKYGWLFSTGLDTFRFYLPDEYYYFNDDEKKFFIYLLNQTNILLRTIKGTLDSKILTMLQQISKEGNNLLKRYLFMYLLFMTFLTPVVQDTKYDAPIKNIKRHLLLSEENGKVYISPELYTFFRRMIVMFDFYTYFFGPYGFFLKDRENIEEIIVNSHEGFVQLMSGGRVVSFYTPYSSEETLSYIDQMLIHRKTSLTEENYIINAELPTGDRTAFVHPIITGNIPNINIRIFKQIPLSVMDFYYFKNFGIDLISLLSILENISSTVFYSGGTGTGKTTALNAFIGLVPKTRFLIIVEDVREMDPFHPPEFTRREVAPREEVFDQLVKAALRHSPDSIVFQEIRTPAVMEAFLDAVNTGHAGSMTTFHASTIEELLQRIKGFNLDPEAMKGLHYIYFIGRFEFKGKQLRRVTSLVEILDAIKTKEGIDIQNNKLFFLTTLSEKGKENQMPMMYFLPQLIGKNPVLYTNYKNKYKRNLTKEDITHLINSHAIFLKQLFEWIRRNPKWDGKKFVIDNIIVTLKEFLPEMVSLFYKYIEQEKEKHFLKNLDKIGSQILIKLKEEKVFNEKRFYQRMRDIQESIFKIIELVIYPQHKKNKKESLLDYVKHLSYHFDIMEHREVIGSRVDMLTFMRLTEI